MQKKHENRARVFFACLLFCAPLKASPLVQLQLEAPAQCPSRDAVEATLARLVTRPPAEPLRVAAQMMRDGDHWVLYVALESGQRVIAGDSCVAVAEALVVLVARVIEPTASLGAAAFQEFERANTPAPTTQSAPASEPPPAEQNVSARDNASWRLYEDGLSPSGSMPPQGRRSVVEEPHRERTARFGMSILMLTEVGSLPSWSIGPSLVARYGSFATWGEVSLSALLPRFAATDADPNEGGRIGWFAAHVGACAGLGHDLPLAGCLGVESGDLFGYGVNAADSHIGYGFWSALTAGALYRSALRRDWGLELRLGAAVPAFRPDFGLQGYGAFFRPGPISARASVGIDWR